MMPNKTQDSPMVKLTVIVSESKSAASAVAARGLRVTKTATLVGDDRSSAQIHK
jgi:hypothetical protein